MGNSYLLILGGRRSKKAKILKGTKEFDESDNGAIKRDSQEIIARTLFEKHLFTRCEGVLPKTSFTIMGGSSFTCINPTRIIRLNHSSISRSKLNNYR
jgi:hypothetical protein